VSSAAILLLEKPFTRFERLIPMFLDVLKDPRSEGSTLEARRRVWIFRIKHHESARGTVASLLDTRSEGGSREESMNESLLDSFKAGSISHTLRICRRFIPFDAS